MVNLLIREKVRKLIGFNFINNRVYRRYCFFEFYVFMQVDKVEFEFVNINIQ